MVPRGIIRLLQIKENGKNRLAVLQCSRYHALSEEVDQSWNGIDGTRIGGGINPEFFPGPKPSASPPFAPTAYKDKRSKKLDENSQAKSDPCLV